MSGEGHSGRFENILGTSHSQFAWTNFLRDILGASYTEHISQGLRAEVPIIERLESGMLRLFRDVPRVSFAVGVPLCVWAVTNWACATAFV